MEAPLIYQNSSSYLDLYLFSVSLLVCFEINFCLANSDSLVKGEMSSFVFEEMCMMVQRQKQ